MHILNFIESHRLQNYIYSIILKINSYMYLLTLYYVHLLTFIKKSTKIKTRFYLD